MAFDQQVRDGLQRGSDRIDPSIEQGLQSALRRGRRRLLGRRMAAVGSAVAIVGLVALAGPRVLDALRSSGVTRPAGSTSPVALFSIEGLWQTRVVTRLEEARVLRAAGYSDADVAFFMRDQGARSTDKYLISFNGSTFITAGAPDGARPAEIDRGSFSLRGTLLTLRYAGGTRSTFRVRVRGDRMTLVLRRDTQPSYQGRPAEIPVIGIYTPAPFARQR